ncbi:MAG: chorismate synthase [Acidobacteria bacterium]|nr:chorismate synthase [Acidobacteriota bacterium]
MNSFGRIFRASIFGESHGAGIGVLIDGCPAGLPLAEEDLRRDLDRRRSGAPGTTPRREPDAPQIRSGIFQGRTTGAPILLIINNRDVDSRDYESMRWTPRPGHADFVAEKKYGGFHDYRGSGHFSGRLTAGLVMAGAVARKLIRPVQVTAVLEEAGGFPQIEEAVQDAVDNKDSIGGVVGCRVTGLPAGLGEPFFDSVESLMSHAVFAIPAIKGIEFGSGFRLARMRGSEANDVILDAKGTTATNHAGGIHGGITNGNDLVFRVVVKPTSSIPREQRTVDMRTGQPAVLQVEGRHDACIALRMPVVVEAATALVLADLMRVAGLIPPVVTE